MALNAVGSAFIQCTLSKLINLHFDEGHTRSCIRMKGFPGFMSEQKNRPCLELFTTDFIGGDEPEFVKSVKRFFFEMAPKSPGLIQIYITVPL